MRSLKNPPTSPSMPGKKKKTPKKEVEQKEEIDSDSMSDAGHPVEALSPSRASSRLRPRGGVAVPTSTAGLPMNPTDAQVIEAAEMWLVVLQSAAQDPPDPSEVLKVFEKVGPAQLARLPHRTLYSLVTLLDLASDLPAGSSDEVLAHAISKAFNGEVATPPASVQGSEAAFEIISSGEDSATTRLSVTAASIKRAFSKGVTEDWDAATARHATLRGPSDVIEYLRAHEAKDAVLVQDLTVAALNILLAIMRRSPLPSGAPKKDAVSALLSAIETYTEETAYGSSKGVKTESEEQDPAPRQRPRPASGSRDPAAPQRGPLPFPHNAYPGRPAARASPRAQPRSPPPLEKGTPPPSQRSPDTGPGFGLCGLCQRWLSLSMMQRAQDLAHYPHACDASTWCCFPCSQQAYANFLAQRAAEEYYAQPPPFYHGGSPAVHAPAMEPGFSAFAHAAHRVQNVASAFPVRPGDPGPVLNAPSPHPTSMPPRARFAAPFVPNPFHQGMPPGNGMAELPASSFSAPTSRLEVPASSGRLLSSRLGLLRQHASTTGFSLWDQGRLNELVGDMQEFNRELRRAAGAVKDTDGNTTTNVTSDVRHQGKAGGDEYFTPRFLQELQAAKSDATFASYLKNKAWYIAAAAEPGQARNAREVLTLATALDFGFEDGAVSSPPPDLVEVLIRRCAALMYVMRMHHQDPKAKANHWDLGRGFESRAITEESELMPPEMMRNIVRHQKLLKDAGH